MPIVVHRSEPYLAINYHRPFKISDMCIYTSLAPLGVFLKGERKPLPHTHLHTRQRTSRTLFYWLSYVRPSSECDVCTSQLYIYHRNGCIKYNNYLFRLVFIDTKSKPSGHHSDEYKRRKRGREREKERMSEWVSDISSNNACFIPLLSFDSTSSLWINESFHESFD